MPVVNWLSKLPGWWLIRLRGADQNSDIPRSWPRLRRPARGNAGPPDAIRQGLVQWGMAFMCILGLIYPLMTIGLDDAPGGDMGGGGAGWQPFLYIAVTGMVLAGLRPLERPERVLAIPGGLLVAVGWATCSLAWAIEPGVGGRRLLFTVLVIWTVCASARAAGYARTLQIVRIVLLSGMVGNYIFALLIPEVGVHHSSDALDASISGDWRGFMGHKNFLGPLCSITFMFFLFGGWSKNKFTNYFMCAISLYCIYKSNSRTSEIATTLSLISGILYLFYNSKYKNFVTAIFIITLSAFIINYYITFNMYDLLLNNNKTLSGRAEIWFAVLKYASKHWLLGAGYGSFWNIGPRAPIYQYGRGWLWHIGEAHNGYLDLLAAVGLPGLVLTVGGTIILPILRLLRSRQANGPRGALAISIITFVTLQNFTESTLLDRGNTTWVFMAFAIIITYIISEDPDKRLKYMASNDQVE